MYNKILKLHKHLSNPISKYPSIQTHKLFTPLNNYRFALSLHYVH